MHPPAVPPPTHTPSGDVPGQRQARRAATAELRYLELEQVTERLCRLVLHAHAVIERMLAHSPSAIDDRGAEPTDRAERLRRLTAGIDLARLALGAAVRMDLAAVDSTLPSDPADSRHSPARRTARAFGARRPRIGLTPVGLPRLRKLSRALSPRD